MRDYVIWHDAYEDPDSGMSWRLTQVREQLHRALDQRSGPVRIMSSCAGDGRDVLGVLRERDDADRVTVTLLEVLPQLAEQARAAAHGLAGVEVRTLDAGRTDAYAGSVPADIVLLVGIFGNISSADVERTVRAAPQFCAPGATLLWSRGRADSMTDTNDDIRDWFADARFTHLEYLTHEAGSRPAIGVEGYDGDAVALSPGQELFTFLR